MEGKNLGLFSARHGIDLTSTGMNLSGSENSDKELVIEHGKSALPTLRAGKRYIHSRHDPAGEASKIIEAANDGTYDCWIFGGFGLGYHIEAFLEACDEAAVIVVEPEPGFLAAAAKSRNLEKILSSEKVFFITSENPEAIVPFLNSMQYERIRYFQLRSVYEYNTVYFENLKKAVAGYVSRKEINNNTLKRFGNLWVKNLSDNLRDFSVSPGLVHLAGKFRGMPALILAGGPGLDQVIPRLKEFHSRYLVIAVDTSLRACLLGGIIPDIVVVVDPQYWNYRHLDRAVEACGRNVILVSEPSTYGRVFRNLGRYAFFAGSVFPLGKYFEDITFQRGKIGAGGSVATSAWDFARQAGCSKALFAGLDLGYPGRQTHFRGSFFEERAHTLSGRVKPAADMDFSLITDASLVEAESYAGTLVLTDRRLTVYRQWFEEQLQMHDFDTFTLSEKGVRVKGIRPVKMDEALGCSIIRDEIEQRTAEIKSFAEKYRAETGEINSGLIRSKVVSLLGSLDLLRESAGQGRETAETLLETVMGGQDESFLSGEVRQGFEKLDEIDRKILSGAERTIAGFLLQDTIREITAENGKKDLVSVIEKSLRIYTALEKSLAINIKNLEKSLRHL